MNNESLRRRCLTDDGEIESPLAEDRFGFFFLFGLEHHEHSLLALRKHHLVRAHPLFAARHLVEIERHAEIALGAHLHRRTGQPGRAHVLDGDDAALLHDLEAGFEQQLFGKWISDLHGRALLFRVSAEFGRGHGRAVNAVSSRLGAEVDDRHANPRSGCIETLVLARDPDRHRVDQAIAVIARVETDRTADRWHAERIAVAADAGDNARNQMPRFRMRRRSERQRIQARDRPGAHGEDVAQNAADAGGCALIGLDVARVIVALHLEHARETITDVDDAGVLARPLDHPWALRRERAQVDLGRFV